MPQSGQFLEKYLTGLIRWGLLIVPFLPLYVANSLFFPFITGKNFAFRIIIEILFAAWLVLALKYRKYWPGKSAIAWSVLALAVVVILSTVFSIDPAGSFWSNAERMEGLFGLLHIWAFFLIATSVFRPQDWLRFFGVSLGVSVLVSGHGILQLLGRAEIHQGSVRVDANFGNATYLAIYLVFHIFLALYFITRYKHKWLQAGLGALILLHLFILFNTATRGAILGLLAGLFVAGFLVTILSGGRVRRWGIAVLLIVVLVPVVFLLVKNTSFVQESPVLSRFATISTSETTTQSRILIWGMALDAWRDRPILGWGPENFTTIFAQYYRPELWRQEPWFDRAHNVLLDWLTASGALGLLAYLSLFGAATALALKISRRGDFSPLQSSLFVGLLAAYFVNNLFVFDNLISLVMFFAVVGYIHSRWTASGQGQPVGEELLVSNYWWRTALTTTGVAVILFSIWAWNIKPIRAAQDLIGGLGAFNAAQQGGPDSAGKIDEAIGQINRAIKRGTFISVESREQLAGYAQSAANNPTLPAEKRLALVKFAIGEMEDQLARSPLDLRARMFLLFLYEANGQFKEGEDLARETINLAPTRQIYRFLYGSILSQQRKLGAALEQFRIAFELDPTYYEAVDFYALALLQSGDDSLILDLVEGRYAEELRRNPEFRNVYTSAQGLEQALRNRYSGVDPRFAQGLASLGNYELASQIYENLIERDIEDKKSPDANYFVQYALLKVQLNKRADAIAMLERMKEFFPNPQHQKEIEDFIADIRAGKTEF